MSSLPQKALSRETRLTADRSPTEMNELAAYAQFRLDYATRQRPRLSLYSPDRLSAK